MQQRFWVAELRISDRVAEKLARKHGLSSQDVSDALVAQERLLGAWNDDPERGRRLLVGIDLGGVAAIAVLYPVAGQEDVWNLGSCYKR